MARRLLLQVLMIAGFSLIGLAGWTQIRADELTAEASVLRDDSLKAGDAFVQTFDGVHQDRELSLLDGRRARLESASTFRRTSLASLLFAVVTLFAAWTAHELRGVTEVLEGHPSNGPGLVPSGAARS